MKQSFFKKVVVVSSLILVPYLSQCEIVKRVQSTKSMIFVWLKTPQIDMDIDAIKNTPYLNGVVATAVFSEVKNQDFSKMQPISQASVSLQGPLLGGQREVPLVESSSVPGTYEQTSSGDLNLKYDDNSNHRYRLSACTLGNGGCANQEYQLNRIMGAPAVSLDQVKFSQEFGAVTEENVFNSLKSILKLPDSVDYATFKQVEAKLKLNATRQEYETIERDVVDDIIKKIADGTIKAEDVAKAVAQGQISDQSIQKALDQGQIKQADVIAAIAQGAIPAAIIPTQYQSLVSQEVMDAIKKFNFDKIMAAFSGSIGLNTSLNIQFPEIKAEEKYIYLVQVISVTPNNMGKMTYTSLPLSGDSLMKLFTEKPPRQFTIPDSVFAEKGVYVVLLTTAHLSIDTSDNLFFASGAIAGQAIPLVLLAQ